MGFDPQEIPSDALQGENPWVEWYPPVGTGLRHFFTMMVFSVLTVWVGWICVHFFFDGTKIGVYEFFSFVHVFFFKSSKTWYQTFFFVGWWGSSAHPGTSRRRWVFWRSGNLVHVTPLPPPPKRKNGWIFGLIKGNQWGFHTVLIDKAGSFWGGTLVGGHGLTSHNNTQ